MDKVIICDECGHEGCTVSEVRPESEKISMKAFAARGKSPYHMDGYQQSEQRDRTWKITCDACDHSIEYREFTPNQFARYIGAVAD